MSSVRNQMRVYCCLSKSLMPTSMKGLTTTFCEGKWINIYRGTFNKLIGALDHDENEYLVLMDEVVDNIVLVRELCQAGKEVICAPGKNNQNLNFNIGHFNPVGC